MSKVNFSDLKKAVENLRYPDEQHFRGTALAKLSQVYDSYPTSIANEKYCFLLVKGSTPKEVAALDESSAAKRVVVLRNEGQNWKRIWPEAGANFAPGPEPVKAPAPVELKKVAVTTAPEKADPDIIWEED